MSPTGKNGSQSHGTGMFDKVMPRLLAAAVIAGVAAAVSVQVLAGDVDDVEAAQKKHEELGMHEGTRQLVRRVDRVGWIVEELYKKEMGHAPPPLRDYPAPE